MACADLAAALTNADAMPSLFRFLLVLIVLGAIGAALTLGARRGGVLLPLLILPLYVPVLIFGVAAVEASVAGLSPRPHLLLLGAIFVLSLLLTPFAAAAAVRQAVE